VKPHPDRWRFGPDSKRADYVNYCAKYFSPKQYDVSDFTISVQELLKSSNVESINGVPKILHQMYKSRTEFSQLFGGYVRNCHDSNPNWKHVIWTDDDFSPFVKQYYPQFYDIFDGFPHFIQKLDTIRYFILHQFGGVYLDADVECLGHDLDEWVSEFSQYDIAMEPIHIIFSPPKHDFWMKVVNETLLNPSHFNEAGQGVLASAKELFPEKILIDRPQEFFREKYFNMLGVSTWRWKMIRQEHVYRISRAIWNHLIIFIPLCTIALCFTYPWWGLQRVSNFRKNNHLVIDDDIILT